MLFRSIVERHPGEQGDILEIVINRPHVMNCIDGETARHLLDAWERFRKDDGLAVAILRSEGNQAFSAGADLKALNELVKLDASDEEVETMIREGTGPLGGTRILQKKPVITIAQGHTYAGGLELYCHGHIRIAERQSLFSVSCRRWGVPLVDGGTVLLPRLLGWGSALPLLITGQRIDAMRAYQIGLVWELAEAGEGRARALSMATQIAGLPQSALRADLSSALEGHHLDINSAFILEAESIYPVVRSKEMEGGVAAFRAGDRSWFT